MQGRKSLTTELRFELISGMENFNRTLLKRGSEAHKMRSIKYRAYISWTDQNQFRMLPSEALRLCAAAAVGIPFEARTSLYFHRQGRPWKPFQPPMVEVHCFTVLWQKAM